jgi:pimeloyl-ACP methyl ester carboxylesterase
MQTNSEVQPGSTREQGHFVTDSVISKDGTTIGYHRIGHGSGLVILHGAMQSALSQSQLAEALAPYYTVILPDRRGRPLSGTYGPNYKIQREVEDLDAILSKTGAHYVFGISSGAVIALEAALSLQAIRKLGIFEPPLVVNGSLSTGFVKVYEQQMAAGKVGDAMVTGMLGGQMGPPFMQKMPRWFLKFVTNQAMKSEDKKVSPPVMPMRQLAPTLHYDLEIALSQADRQEHYRPITVETLLLGGDQSAFYLRNGLDVLEKVLPNAKHVVMTGAHHGATGNPNRGGLPKRIAEELHKFFN